MKLHLSYYETRHLRVEVSPLESFNEVVGHLTSLTWDNYSFIFTIESKRIQEHISEDAIAHLDTETRRVFEHIRNGTKGNRVDFVEIINAVYFKEKQ